MEQGNSVETSSGSYHAPIVGEGKTGPVTETDIVKHGPEEDTTEMRQKNVAPDIDAEGRKVWGFDRLGLKHLDERGSCSCMRRKEPCLCSAGGSFCHLERRGAGISVKVVPRSSLTRNGQRVLTTSHRACLLVFFCSTKHSMVGCKDGQDVRTPRSLTSRAMYVHSILPSTAAYAFP